MFFPYEGILVSLDMTNSNHNRRSIRLPGYDYSQAGAYYVTICVQDRLCLFGDVMNGEVMLNDIGLYVDRCWLEIPKHFPNVVLHEYIIMPNHVHGIIEIVGANNDLPLDKEKITERAKDILPLRGTSKTVGSIVRGFKIGVTKYVRKCTDIYKVWQRNYYEHIIRDYEDYIRIADYIEDNPINWERDDMFVF